MSTLTADKEVWADYKRTIYRTGFHTDPTDVDTLIEEIDFLLDSLTILKDNDEAVAEVLNRVANVNAALRKRLHRIKELAEWFEE